jgi:hypothetical protein
MSQRIADELEHRRGLVLGLTLAEVLLLLLFVLLLALSGRIVNLQRDVATERQRAEGLSVQLVQRESALASLTPLLEELQSKGGLDVPSVKELADKVGRADTIAEENARLIRANTELSNTLGTMRRIGSDPANLKAIEDTLATAAKINPNDPPEALKRAMEIFKRLGAETQPDQVKPLSEVIADSQKLKAFDKAVAGATKINPNDPPEALQRAVEVLNRLGPDTTPDQVTPIEQQNRVRRERDNLMRSGNGLTFPSCWTTADGHTEYMFDVIIQDNGLILREATPRRANDPALKFVSGIPRNELINEKTFSTGTAELLKHSQDQRCRFYSIIRDGTGPTNKQRYIQLRTLVEGPFYPAHRRLAVPVSPPVAVPANSSPPMGGEYVPAPLPLRRLP